MCSLAEGGFLAEEFVGDVTGKLEGRQCQKCKAVPAQLILRKKDVYCVDCFVAGSKHKFRSTLGKNKVMYKGDKVLLPFDGSANCLTMLDLVHSSLVRDASPKRHFYTVTLVISDFDFAGNCGVDALARREKVTELIQLAKKFTGFEVQVGNFESSLITSDKSDSHVKLCDVNGNGSDYEIPESDLDLTQVLSGFKESSAKEDFLRTLESKMMVKAAKQSKCNKIFQSDCASDLAVTLMAGCATGRGINLPDDTGFLDQRYQSSSCDQEEQTGENKDQNGGDLMVLRPMREFSHEEIQHYVNFVLPREIRPASSENERNSATIRGLTKQFLYGLQANFPATIPTIFRTTGKLMSAVNDHQDEGLQCPVCDGKTRDMIDSPSVEATEVSRLISSIGKFKEGGLDLSTEAIASGQILKGEKLNEISSKDREELRGKLCYSCRLVLDRMQSVPSFIQEEANASSIRRRQKLREQIKDLLIEH